MRAPVAQLDIDPFGEDFLADPYAHHAALRDSGAVVWPEPIETCAMARFAEVQSALRDHATFLLRAGHGAGGLLQGSAVPSPVELARQIGSLRLAGEPVRRLNSTLHAIASLPVEAEPA